jgi:2,3,4,5-tetrahydropyridine-2-carboxylate N-succinyltransferase
MKQALALFEGSPVATDPTPVLLKRLCYSPVAERVVVTILTEDTAPTTTEEVYLKLSLLSHRLVQPHDVNLEGLFNLLPNVAWTSEGPIAVDELAERQLAARLEGRVLEIYSVDKFPKMVNYIVPSQVRIADAARVRLGAYLGAGTTVMHAGFVNFNAGTAGPNMVEGRISAGVFVDSGSDLGGACSTLGTLSGGNSTRVRIGKNCLIGANAGAGISLGDNSTIEAGLYVTAGSKVELLDITGKKVGLVKAKELADKPGLLFRRNSATGRIEALEGKFAIQLNDVLHVNR